MKGLWIKDLELLKLQKNFFIIMFIISILIILFNKSPDFIIGYLPFMVVISTINTLNYDEDHNSITYLMTLPIQRKTYIYEKYGFVISISACTLCIATIVSVLFSYIQNIPLPKEYIFLPLTIFVSIILLISISIPFQIKYGAQRGRIGMIICFGLFFLFLIVFVKILTYLEINPGHMIQILSQMNLNMIIFSIFIFISFLTWVSIKCSIHIIENKEY